MTARHRWRIVAAALLVAIALAAGAVMLPAFMPDPPRPDDRPRAAVLDPAACSTALDQEGAAALAELDRRTGLLTEVCGPARADELAGIATTAEPADPIDLLGLEPVDPDDLTTGTLVPLESGTGTG